MAKKAQPKSTTKKSAKPKGLDITRKGDDFICSWKHGETYEDQSFKYQIKSGGKWGKEHGLNVGKNAKSKKINLNASDYYPNSTNKPTLDKIKFIVKGRAKDSKKNWKPWSVAVDHEYDIKKPTDPSVSVTLTGNATNEATCSVSVAKAENNTHEWFTKSCVWTKVVANAGGNSNLGAWVLKNASAPASYSWTQPEDTSMSGWLSNVSYTRFVKAEASGPRGTTSPKIGYHIYAKPLKPYIYNNALSFNSSGGMNVTVWWNTNATALFPVDSCAVEYKIGTPGPYLGVPGGSWSKAPYGTVKDPNSASHNFTISERPDEDQCFWVRIVNRYDNDDNITASDPWLFLYGLLKTPTISDEVEVDPDTRRATVTVENRSSVPGSYVILNFIIKKNGTVTREQPVAIFPPGSGSQTISGIELPVWGDEDSITFSAQAAVTKTGAPTDVSQLKNVTKHMVSLVYQLPGDVPLPPANVNVDTTDVDGTARISWRWNWSEATAAEISWADHRDAWESTDEPSTYVVNSTRASAWNISGLTTGTKWYIRIRFLSVRGDSTTYGLYSAIHDLDLRSAPATPSLELLPDYVTVDGTTTAAWGYVSTDGTPQMAAEIAEVITENGETTYVRIAETETAQHVLIGPSSLLGDVPRAIRDTWTTGSSHALALKLKSGSQIESDWSVPKQLIVLNPLSVNLSGLPFVSRSYVIDEGEAEETITDATSLVAMPFNITVTGAGSDGETHISITRTEPYLMTRPDDTEYGGFEGETILSKSFPGEGTFQITNDDLVGYLDDGAPYTLHVSVSDMHGQIAELEEPIDFIVHWDHQAKVPDGLVEIDEDYDVAYLTPVAPTPEEGETWTLAETDVCDIYRLSTDRPELIVSDGEWGTKYVDPYPAIGENAGYRFVFKTANNDYIAEKLVAWTDIYAGLDILNNIIDFGNDSVDLLWNVDLSSAWKKDFKETQYLGGSVVGDWNPAISRTGSVTGVVVKAIDNDTIMAMRRLANHAGICHVRTVDGSSYAADVQVSESRGHEPSDLTVNFTLNVTRVDTEEPDGMLYADWAAENIIEPEEEE